MSLARALAQLPSDRESERIVRDLLHTLKGREGESVSAEELARLLAMPSTRLRTILAVLADAFVVDCDAGSVGSCRYLPDSILRREVDAFLRRAESHSGMLQANVAKFRQRYNMR